MHEIYQYLSQNPYSCPGTALRRPLGMVVHWVNNPGTSAMANRNYFESLKAGGLNPQKGRPDYASAHDIVGLDGEVVHCVPPQLRAYHCGATQPIQAGSQQFYTNLARTRWPSYTLDYQHQSPNAILLGIEYCHPDSSGQPNPATLDSLIQLLASYCSRFDLDPLQDLYLHQEIVGYKDCPFWYNHHPDDWQALIHLVVQELAAIRRAPCPIG